MNANERRAALSSLLAQSDAPQSASALAMRFSVSRQIIVGDIALLRAGGLAVTATPRGYLLEPPFREGNAGGVERTLACIHGNDRMAQELYTVVDLGGALLDVTVDHAVYGELRAPLHIYSRYDADLFLRKINAPDARPLSALTGGVHLHRIRCASEDIFSRVRHALADGGLLYDL